jgi:threonine dehydrogenase-like Zn-dependent dehydrogenase
MDLTGGEGVDAAIEAFGFPQTLEACVRVTKAGGRVSNIGYHGENPNPLQLPLDARSLGASRAEDVPRARYEYLELGRRSSTARSNGRLRW